MENFSVETGSPSKRTLYYVHDPMCSWCWAFRPVWDAVSRQLPESISVQNLLGGLAPDSHEPMPPAMQKQIRGFWQTIERRVPGTTFNYDFWTKCVPRRSTWPACRAVIAARAQGAKYEEPMILAIQEAYYLEAKNPSDDLVLSDLAESLGMDRATFMSALNSSETQKRLACEIQLSRKIGTQGFPSLVLLHGERAQIINIDYNNSEAILSQFV